MAIPSLLGSYIDQTYPRLVQTSGSEFADGLGNPILIGISGGTDTYIPLWSGSNALTSSFLQQTNNTIQTVYNGTINSGIFLNLSQSEYRFGAWNTGNFTNIIITDGVKAIDVDSIGEIRIGDGSGNQNGTILSVNDTSQLIKTSQGGFDKGLSLDFASLQYSLGDHNNINNSTKIVINDTSSSISLSGSVSITGSFNDGIPKLILTGVTDSPADTLTYNTVVNTLGDTFTFTATNGVYELTMDTATPFTSGYTYIMFTAGLPAPGGGNVYNTHYEYIDDSTINFYVKKNDEPYGGVLTQATIDIRVYPSS